MMKTISVAYKLGALHRIARQGRIWGEAMSRSNQEQRKILAFARRHGDAAACATTPTLSTGNSPSGSSGTMPKNPAAPSPETPP